MDYPHITHHGAQDGVTGSCHQLDIAANSSVLIDCGLFQGADASSHGARANHQVIDFPLDGIRALIVTHVHIDHVGRIPYLFAAGFKGPILCSEPSAKLLPIVLEDAFKLTFSRDQKQVERYIKEVQQRIIALPYNHWFTLHDSDGLVSKVRLQRAAHMLGSAYVEVDLQYHPGEASKRIVFSGDLGAPNAPILKPCIPPRRADILVLESTYGDRLHEDRSTRRQRLEQVIEHALANNGTVLIPAFSVGRTQELLYELEDIIHSKKLDARTSGTAALPGYANTEATTDQSTSPSGRGTRGEGCDPENPQAVAPETNWPQLPIILDSPLASRFTQAYRELKDFWNDEAQARVQSGRRPLAFDQLITVDSHAEHQKILNRLVSSARPAIVIAGNGMCSSGRIVNYLKAMLGDPRHDVLFVGYQARGTPGHAIQRFGPGNGYVEFDGQRYDIRAGVASIGGYSAHADQAGLVSFVTEMEEWPSEIRLVHGEAGAKAALQQALLTQYAQKGLPLIIDARRS
ncbi:MBL fold hydrolase [Pseudomonas daroniae]|uniref:MBL fold hydrolase n=1 Tax=Phytopseudomonas daroniae TaxID=2487519 RepID=A0A4Q9QP03_9GAMM|nr:MULTISPECIES: MBL fold metallo-hydrolase [Pseudomonas]TBU81929.1 MBL fold hydrolase [Pseudomonas daroniae]TBU84734.1 MBL fold hydrolase [Pseudomonas sp. FRB 228]TBU92231.1 MBL fold hydrolase [Pseudomonas daroniae]